MNKEESYEAGKNKAEEVIKDIEEMEFWKDFLVGFFDGITTAFEDSVDDESEKEE